MATFRYWFDTIQDYFVMRLFTLGSTHITLLTIINIVVFTFLLVYLSGKLKNWIAEGLLTRTRMEVGARQATGSIVRYFVIVIGFIIILQTVGIDLTALNVMAGAVGIGLGFGLQNIVNNFISGIIILFERPIMVGDRIEVGKVEGDVVRISGRSTTVVTNDNISIIVPNSKFITENVVNWSHNDRMVRFRVPVTVAYASDVKLVERLLLEAAADNPDVLVKPDPAVRLMEFCENGLCFELRVWSTTLIHRKGLLISSLNLAILDKFNKHGIEMPNPRRDLFVLGGSLELRKPISPFDSGAEL